MIDSLMLIDDENLFHLVFEDACSILDIALNLTCISSSDEADRLFDRWNRDEARKPDCVFVDLNIIGSLYNGIELINRINTLHGNSVVIGIISSSSDNIEIEKAKEAGAMFWIVKTDEIEPRLEEFKRDYPSIRERTLEFRMYR